MQCEPSLLFLLMGLPLNPSYNDTQHVAAVNRELSVYEQVDGVQIFEHTTVAPLGY